MNINIVIFYSFAVVYSSISNDIKMETSELQNLNTETATQEACSNISGDQNPEGTLESEDDDNAKLMSFDEIRELSFDVDRLPGDKIERVIEIVLSREPKLRKFPDLFEIDFETLKQSTLREIVSYVDSCLGKKTLEQQNDVQDSGKEVKEEL